MMMIISFLLIFQNLLNYDFFIICKMIYSAFNISSFSKDNRMDYDDKQNCLNHINDILLLN